jgi:hypothetical protein
MEKPCVMIKIKVVKYIIINENHIVNFTVERYGYHVGENLYASIKEGKKTKGTAGNCPNSAN